MAADAPFGSQRHGRQIGKTGISQDGLCLLDTQAGDTQIGILFQPRFDKGLQLRVGKQFAPRQRSQRYGIFRRNIPVQTVGLDFRT